MNQHKQPILKKVREVVELAKDKYNFDINFNDIEIKFVTRGNAAAQAMHHTRFGRDVYGLQFSLESADLDIAEMLDDTVPHEVAHLVNYRHKHTGKNHNSGWIRVCKALGGTGARLHDQILTKAKYRKAYMYITSNGTERLVKSAAKHRKIQRGATYTFRRTGESYGRSHFVRVVSSDEMRRAHEVQINEYRASKNIAPTSHNRPTPTPPASQNRPTRTKKVKAMEIYNTYSSSPRSSVIQMFITRLGMTKAGASTYYHNCKNS